MVFVNERDFIGYIPVTAERYPSTPSDIIEQTENKYGYIQVKEGFPFLIYLLPILLLLILLVLIVRSVGGSGSYKKNVVLPDNKHDLTTMMLESKKNTEEPNKIQDSIQTPAPTKEPEKEEKNTPVAVLPMNPVVVPGNKVVAKPVSVIALSLIEDTSATTLSVPAPVSDVSSGDVRSVSDGNTN